MAAVAAIFDTLTFLIFCFLEGQARPAWLAWPGQCYIHTLASRPGRAGPAGPAGLGPASPPAPAGSGWPRAGLAGPGRRVRPQPARQTPGGKGPLWGKVTNEKLPYVFGSFRASGMPSVPKLIHFCDFFDFWCVLAVFAVQSANGVCVQY